MQITVKLFSGYHIGRFKEAVQDYPVGSTVGDLFQALDFTIKAHGIVLLNGKPAKLDQQLLDGDTLALFPLVSGGCSTPCAFKGCPQ